MNFILFCNVAYYVGIELIVAGLSDWKDIMAHSILNLIYLATILYVYLTSDSWILFLIISVVLVNVSWISIITSHASECEQ